MSSSELLTGVLGNEPWAVSGLIYGLDRLLDEEGRPVSERRAPSIAKQGVVMELRRCPYQDERQGKPMNISALAQITKHLDAVLADVATFRGSLPASSGWSGFLAAVLDQLAAPALQVLRSRSDEQPVPAQLSVGHKLAAGYFGVAYGILTAEAQGRHREPTSDSVLQFVRESGALIGASEVCAGPLHLIGRATEVFLHGRSSARVSEARLAIAETLAMQVRIGLGWELFDAATERQLLLELLPRPLLQPRTSIILRALDERLVALAALQNVATWEQAATAIPEVVPPTADRQAADSLRTLFRSGGAAASSTARSQALLLELLGEARPALELTDASLRPSLAWLLAGYLEVYRATVGTLYLGELSLRTRLGYPTAAPMKLSSLIFPFPKTVRWLEALLGHWLRCTPAAIPTLQIINPQRSVALPT
jgi:hypothetical protein